MSKLRDRNSFSPAERARLWPMAETLAMIDGNAFFVMNGEYNVDLVSSYLPNADEIYQSNGGDNGWAGEAILATLGHRNASAGPGQLTSASTSR